MKITIRNTAGRVLGIYAANSEREAFEAMCIEAGYPDGDTAQQKRFASFERCAFHSEAEVTR